MQTSSLDDILLTSNSGAELLRRLYDFKKAENAKYSLVFLCRAAGIKSKGYLADVMKGRRKLNPEYWDGLATGIGLSGMRAELFVLLLRYDAADGDAERDALVPEIAAHRKAVAASDEILPDRLRGMFFAFEVFCAFGLFKNTPTKDDLRGYFGRSMGVELDAALHLLTSSGLAAADGNHYKLLRNVIKFVDSEDGISLVNFARLAIDDGLRKVDHWLPRRDEAFYESNMISVRSKDYFAALPRIKESVRKMQTDLESSDADMILRFNIQIYPSR